VVVLDEWEIRLTVPAGLADAAAAALADEVGARLAAWAEAITRDLAATGARVQVRR
jgi:hypothetical protein